MRPFFSSIFTPQIPVQLMKFYTPIFVVMELTRKFYESKRISGQLHESLLYNRHITVLKIPYHMLPIRFYLTNDIPQAKWNQEQLLYL